jgi:hypothetical protein
MKLNQKKNTHVIVDGSCISVQYYMTMDDVAGQQPAPYKIWVIINFAHPQTKSIQRLRVEEPQDLIEATDAELQSFIESEIECFFRHCDEENEGGQRRMIA